MKKYQITIKDTETGETLVDINTGAIIGAVDNGAETRTICLTHCNSIDLAATTAGALRSANKAMAEMPKALAEEVRVIGNFKNNN